MKQKKTNRFNANQLALYWSAGGISPADTGARRRNRLPRKGHKKAAGNKGSAGRGRQFLLLVRKSERPLRFQRVQRLFRDQQEDKAQ